MSGFDKELVLASGSAARAAVLAASGLAFIRQPSHVDERAIAAGYAGAADALAVVLAEAKAAAVAERQDDTRLVLGADQILTCDGARFDKPTSLADARERLVHLRAREHQLVNGLCLYGQGKVQWRYSGAVRLFMRDFSDDCLDSYMEAEGKSLLDSVGAYRLESGGAQLFERIEGDYFSVLGLPLLPLLTALRDLGVAMR